MGNFISRSLIVGLKGLGILVSLILLLGSLVVVAKHPGAGGILLMGAMATVGLGACSLVCASIFGSEVSRLQTLMRGQPARCWLLGCLLLVFQIWCLTALPARPLLALLFLFFDFWCLARSCPALAGWVGAEVCENVRWQTGVGGVMLGLTAATPILGWLVSAQLILLSLGAAVCPRRWSAA